LQFEDVSMEYYFLACNQTMESSISM